MKAFLVGLGLAPFAIILGISAAIFLAGCGFTPQGDAVREFIELRSQKAADQSAENARKYLCEYARVGSISKLFPGEDGRKAYLKFCEKRGPVVP